MTRDESSLSFVIIRHNVRTYRSAGVVEVVKGLRPAEAALRRAEDRQTSADRHEGWRYFVEETDLKPGMDPAEATARRQASLALREAKHSAND